MKAHIKIRSRAIILALFFFLPRDRRIRLERWLRGRDEARRLAKADVVVVSFGKSGRTWLRVMISRYYQLRYGISEQLLLRFSNYHRHNAEIPRILFTHDNYLQDYTGEASSKVAFYTKKVILLVRNPKDVGISQYFQWKFRMRPDKMIMNRYPPHGAEIRPYDFVMDPNCGLPRIIDYLNLWARELDHVENLLIVRYEDMRNDTVDSLQRILDFVDGRPADAAIVADAVAYASIENMRRLEQESVFQQAGTRMTPGKVGAPNSYKVRRAKVDGYRDYFSDEEVERIDAIVAKSLSPDFGYAAAPPGPDPDRSVGHESA